MKTPHGNGVNMHRLTLLDEDLDLHELAGGNDASGAHLHLVKAAPLVVVPNALQILGQHVRFEILVTPPRGPKETQEFGRLASGDATLEIGARDLAVARETNGSDTDPRLGYRLARKSRRHDDQREPPQLHRCAHCKTRPNRNKPALSRRCARRVKRTPRESSGSKRKRYESIAFRVSFRPSV